jgi:hypothetical protein
METLTLNGKEYVKASKAAKDLGYASDYVGQLCRTGSVEAHLVGRTWYVNPETLGAHRLEKKRNSRVKAREYARKSIEASRTLSVTNSANSYKNIAIRYQPDTDAVIPQVKKVHIVTERFLEHQPVVEEETSYEILNKNKKILMSGSIPVYDADEETVLTDTVTLTPKIVKSAKKRTIQPAHVPEDNETTMEERPIEPPPVPSATESTETFEEKLIKAEVHVESFDTVEVESDQTMQENFRNRFPIGTTGLCILSVLAICSVAGLFFERHYTYTAGEFTETFNPTLNIVSDFALKYKDILSGRY